MTQEIQQERVIIGRFGSPHGLKGWLRVQSFTEPSSNIFNYSTWQIYYQHQWQVIQCLAHQSISKRFVAQIENCHDRTQAESYINTEIAIFAHELPVLSGEEYYWRDLVGLSVVDIDGSTLGAIDHLLETGSNDVFVIKGESDYFIPYLDEYIKTIDLKARQMRVDWKRFLSE